MKVNLTLFYIEIQSSLKMVFVAFGNDARRPAVLAVRHPTPLAAVWGTSQDGALFSAQSAEAILLNKFIQFSFVLNL